MSNTRRITDYRNNSVISRFELEKRLNALELSFQRHLQERDKTIEALKRRVSDLEDNLRRARV